MLLLAPNPDPGTAKIITIVPRRAQVAGRLMAAHNVIERARLQLARAVFSLTLSQTTPAAKCTSHGYWQERAAFE